MILLLVCRLSNICIQSTYWVINSNVLVSHVSINERKKGGATMMGLESVYGTDL